MSQPTINPEDSHPPSLHIIEQWKEVKQSLPFDDQQDFDDSRQGWRGHLHPNQVTNDQGVVWDNDVYDFPEGGRSILSQPKSVAPVATYSQEWTISCRRAHLPSAWTRPLEHDHH